mmetsp:Transcript_28196/g.41528  ORF Transcript_28196/g.41528 Transcript_28196/m.41528 type:complete len:222 (+) Transcript_28196:946-1611(+)
MRVSIVMLTMFILVNAQRTNDNTRALQRHGSTQPRQHNQITRVTIVAIQHAILNDEEPFLPQLTFVKLFAPSSLVLQPTTTFLLQFDRLILKCGFIHSFDRTTRGRHFRSSWRSFNTVVSRLLTAKGNIFILQNLMRVEFAITELEHFILFNANIAGLQHTLQLPLPRCAIYHRTLQILTQFDAPSVKHRIEPFIRQAIDRLWLIIFNRACQNPMHLQCKV